MSPQAEPIVKHFITFNCRNRTGELAELLLDAGASPCDQENKKNTTPLHLAVTRYNVNTFDRLIKEDECGINVQVVDQTSVG